MRTPLESLLNLKRWEEDEAKGRFALLLKDLAVEEARLADLEARYETAGRKAAGGARNAVTIDELKRHQDFLEFLLKSIHRQVKVIRKKELEVEKARLALLNASKERKTFERLEEKRKEAVEKEHLRKERIVTDEHGSARHSRNKV